MNKPVYWAGPIPDCCQISGRAFGGVMYDAKIGSSAWACIDQVAFVNLRCNLGVGFGQKYELQTDGKWLQTAGGAVSMPVVTLSAEDRRQIREEAQSRRGAA